MKRSLLELNSRQRKNQNDGMENDANPVKSEGMKFACGKAGGLQSISKLLNILVIAIPIQVLI